jgi:hypothetical protein
VKVIARKEIGCSRPALSSSLWAGSSNPLSFKPGLPSRRLVGQVPVTSRALERLLKEETMRERFLYNRLFYQPVRS